MASPPRAFATGMILFAVVVFALAVRAELPGEVTKLTTAEEDLCAKPEMRETVRAILLDALDVSLRNHVQHAFDVWMRDAAGQPERARRGVSQGVKAYVAAREKVMSKDWLSC